MKSIETGEELEIIKEVESGSYASLKDDEMRQMKNMLKNASVNTILKVACPHFHIHTCKLFFIIV